jgi:RNA polymerase sigma-70 factor (ECF subfamily)
MHALWEWWDCRNVPFLRMKERVSSRSDLSARFLREARESESSSDAANLPASQTLDFEQVYSEHFHHVSRWARALGGLDADLDDLAQEVFLVVRRKLGSYRGPSLPAWLYGITRKTVSDYRRRAFMRRLLGGMQRSLDASPQLEHASKSEPFDRWEAQRTVRTVLEKMSNVRRTAFVLFEIEGYSGEEIAELEQIPVATVYTRLHHARKDFLRLTAELTGLPYEERKGPKP